MIASPAEKMLVMRANRFGRCLTRCFFVSATSLARASAIASFFSSLAVFTAFTVAGRWTGVAASTGLVMAGSSLLMIGAGGVCRSLRSCVLMLA